MVAASTALHVILVRFCLGSIGVTSTFDDAAPSMFFVKVLVHGHSGQVVAGSENALLELRSLAKESERLKWFA